MHICRSIVALTAAGCLGYTFSLSFYASAGFSLDLFGQAGVLRFFFFLFRHMQVDSGEQFGAHAQLSASTWLNSIAFHGARLVQYVCDRIRYSEILWVGMVCESRRSCVRSAKFSMGIFFLSLSLSVVARPVWRFEAVRSCVCFVRWRAIESRNDVD